MKSYIFKWLNRMFLSNSALGRFNFDEQEQVVAQASQTWSDDPNWRCFFLDSCKIKRDVIQELGEGVSIVQVKGRGMWDKEKEASVRKARPDSLGGGLAGSPWGWWKLGRTASVQYKEMKPNQQWSSREHAHFSDFWVEEPFLFLLQAYAFAELWEDFSAVKTVIFWDCFKL